MRGSRAKTLRKANPERPNPGRVNGGYIKDINGRSNGKSTVEASVRFPRDLPMHNTTHRKDRLAKQVRR